MQGGKDPKLKSAHYLNLNVHEKSQWTSLGVQDHMRGYIKLVHAM